MLMEEKMGWIIAGIILLVALAYPLYRFYIFLLFHRRSAKPIPGKIHIACVGDSITFGAGVLKTQKTESYPAYLQELLGDGYQTINYGLTGRTLLQSGDLQYIREKLYPVTFQTKPDIYIIMLGTNDAKRYFWDEEAYRTEMKAFLQRYISEAGNDHVIVMKPPRVFIAEGQTEEMFDIRNRNVQCTLGILENLAAEQAVHVIDLYQLTENHPGWFTDGVHPTAEGNKRIAEHIFGEMKQFGL